MRHDKLRHERIMIPGLSSQVEQSVCQQMPGDEHLPYALTLPLSAERQPARRSLGSLTATQRCTDDRCAGNPPLLWSECLAFDGNLAVRRDIGMSSAEPAPDVALRGDAHHEPGCRCDLSQSSSAPATTLRPALPLGTVRALAGGRRIKLSCAQVCHDARTRRSGPLTRPTLLPAPVCPPQMRRLS